MKPYEESFPVGSRVQIADRLLLEEFLNTWKYHDRPERDQLEFSGTVTTVEKVGFYHGGEPLYILDKVPGVWHEKCLRRVA